MKIHLQIVSEFSHKNSLNQLKIKMQINDVIADKDPVLKDEIRIRT